jgi:P4 family phage/plasmid primase-like protien
MNMRTTKLNKKDNNIETEIEGKPTSWTAPLSYMTQITATLSEDRTFFVVELNMGDEIKQIATPPNKWIRSLKQVDSIARAAKYVLKGKDEDAVKNIHEKIQVFAAQIGMDIQDEDEPSKKNLIKYYGDFILKNWIIKTLVQTGEMWYYDKRGYYLPQVAQLIGKFCAETDELTNNINWNIRNITTYIKGKTGCDEFQETIDLINLRNGVFEVRNKVLSEHSPKYNFRGRLELDYNANATCPEFIWLIENALPDEKDRKLLQEVFGYFLLGTMTKHFHIFAGVPNSGKTVIARILSELLGGKEKVSGHSLSAISNKGSKAVAYMHDMKANIDSDMEYDHVKDISMLKKLTGGDPISVRKLWEGFGTFYNITKLLFACNRLPELSKKVKSDKAFWERVILLKFNKPLDFNGKKKLNLDEALTNVYAPEMVGILNWALEGARLYLEHGFTYDFQNSYEFWFEETGDSLKHFLNFYFEFKEEGKVDAEDMRKCYDEYCRAHAEYKKLSQKEFGMELGEFDIHRKQYGRGSNRGKYYYAGVSLK